MTWVVLIILAIAFVILFRKQLQTAFLAVSDWMRKNLILGTFLFMVVYITLHPMGLGFHVFTVLGAFVYGHAIGLYIGCILFYFVNFFCQFTGTELTFYMTRFCFKKCTQSIINKKTYLKAFVYALNKNSKKFVCLSRLCHIAPQYLITNICAVSSMKSIDFFIGNLAMAPMDIPLIIIAASVSDFAKA